MLSFGEPTERLQEEALDGSLCIARWLAYPSGETLTKAEQKKYGFNEGLQRHTLYPSLYVYEEAEPGTDGNRVYRLTFRGGTALLAGSVMHSVCGTPG